MQRDLDQGRIGDARQSFSKWRKCKALQHHMNDQLRLQKFAQEQGAFLMMRMLMKGRGSLSHRAVSIKTGVRSTFFYENHVELQN